MTAITITDRRADRAHNDRFEEIHVACAHCDPDTALCGDKRNGRPFKPGAELTCVVCADLRETHHYWA